MQISTAYDINYFDKFAKYKYKLAGYRDNKLPCIFYGCYNSSDIYKIQKHQGLKFLIWGGSDIIIPNILKIVSRIPNLVFIAQSNFIADDLKKYHLSYIYIPFSPTVDYQKFQSVIKGPCIYVYLNIQRPKVYKYELVKRLQKYFPDIEFIIASNKECIVNAVRKGTYIQGIQTHDPQEMPKIYEKCFLGLRFVDHDGISASVQEMGLMGIKTIYNGRTPSSISYKTFDDIIQIIKDEHQKIGTIDHQTADDVKNYLEMGDQLIYYLSNPLVIKGDSFYLRKNNKWISDKSHLDKTNNQWIITKFKQQLFTHQDDTIIPSLDGWKKLY